MNDERASDAFPAPIVRRRRAISPIWIVPLVALLVGAWLGYRTLSEQGPTITITFTDGSGLEEGKTPIKYRSVTVGEVRRIVLADDLSTVEITAEVDKRMARHLTDATRFWIVRPRIGAQGVSGLSTLVSGAYVEMEPGEGASARAFSGLEVPPIVGARELGRRFLLTSPTLGSLSVGSPVYFRSIPVGQVLGHELAEDRSEVNLHVFVKAPYHDLVISRSRFWNVSGVEVSVGADGLNMRVDALHSLLTGGLSFDSPSSPGIDVTPSPDGARFPLYESARALTDTIASPSEEAPLIYALYFSGSVRGLARDAPVEFRGIKIGKVRSITLELDHTENSARIPVLIEIDRRRIVTIGTSSNASRELVDDPIGALVRRGLRARLQTGSLLTGQLFVDMKSYEDLPSEELGHNGKHPVIPTVPSTLEKFERSAQDALAQLGKLPLDELVAELVGAARGANKLFNGQQASRTLREVEDTFKQYKKLAGNIGTEVAPLARSLQSTSAAAQQALALAAPGSELRYDLNATLTELAAAARSLRVLAEYLERHPEALLTGKGRSRN